MTDRHVRRGKAEYAAAFEQLLPRGAGWSREPDSIIMKAVRGLAGIWAYVDDKAAQLLEFETDPRLAGEMLPDWERAWGLPDECIAEPISLADRRKILLQRMTLLGAQSREFFIGVAQELGYEIRIIERLPFQCGISWFGDTRNAINLPENYGWPMWEIGPPELRYSWFIQILETRLTWWRFGAAEIGIDPHLRIALATDLECIIRRWKPAHTVLFFDYSQVSFDRVGSGNLAAGAALVSGVGTASGVGAPTGTGALVAAPATVSGLGIVQPYTGIGTLQAGAATISGFGAIGDLVAPILAWDGDTLDPTPDFEVTLPMSAGTGDTFNIEWDTVQTFDGPNHGTQAHVITADEDFDDQINLGLPTSLADNTWYFRANINGGPWSEIETVVVLTNPPLALSYTGWQVSDQNTANISWWVDIGSAFANRKVIIGMAAGNSYQPAPSMVTINGVQCIPANGGGYVQYVGSGGWIGTFSGRVIWAWADVPSGSGVVEVVMSNTSGAGEGSTVIAAYVCDKTDLVDAAPTHTSNNVPGGSTQNTVSLNTGDMGILIAASVGAYHQPSGAHDIALTASSETMDYDVRGGWYTYGPFYSRKSDTNVHTPFSVTFGWSNPSQHLASLFHWK